MPIVIEPWVLLATAGQEVTVRPLGHVRGGNGPIRLNAVPAKAGITVVPSFETGTFTFRSDEVRTHYLEFTVTDGEQTATGLVRIDVAAPPDANTRPITVPKTIFVTTLSSQTVDPTTTDIDPAGGVLVVTGVMNVPPPSVMRAEVIDQRLVRVTLASPLDAPVTINYRISNGLAEAEGTITVVEIPKPLSLQPPIATDDSVTVRVGDAIDIHVLDNDEQPDGAEITLDPQLEERLPDGAGLLFAAGNRLRYLAPQTAGNYTAVYSVVGPDGQRAQARVLISVRERNAATNNPPVPRTVVARVIAGETVRIEVPLSGIDPDGDAVQLIGQETNPEKGAVLSVGVGGDRVRGGGLLLGHRHLPVHGGRRSRRPRDRHHPGRHQREPRGRAQPGRQRRHGDGPSRTHGLGAGARQRLRPGRAARSACSRPCPTFPGPPWRSSTRPSCGSPRPTHRASTPSPTRS